VVTSGRTVQERLAADGIAADWVPKGFEPARFPTRSGRRTGIATYGSAYACRQVAERALRDEAIPLTRLDTTSYVQLGARLNQFLGCLTISSELEESSSRGAASGSSFPCSRFAKFGAPGVGESWARGADGGARGRLRLARCCRGRGLRLVAGRGADLGRGPGGCRSGTPAAAPEALLLPRDDDAERRAPRAPLPNLVRA